MRRGQVLRRFFSPLLVTQQQPTRCTVEGLSEGEEFEVGDDAGAVLDAGDVLPSGVPLAVRDVGDTRAEGILAFLEVMAA
jgi:hypothetical protein